MRHHITNVKRPSLAWGGWLLLTAGVFLASPVLAQNGVNPTKAAKGAAESIQKSAEGGGNTAQAATGAMEDTASPAAESPAADAAAPATTPTGVTPPVKAAGPQATDAQGRPVEISPLDQYHKRTLTKAQEAAVLQRAFEFMKYYLKPSVVDVRDATFDGGRSPWTSRAPRTNPFDPQIAKPLPFNQWDLDSAPPPPYYPPAQGLKLQSLQDAFQQFLDDSQLVGIVSTSGTRTAIVKFGRSQVHLRVGEEYSQKDYSIKVRDISDDSVVVQTVGGDLSGILTLDSATGLLVGEGERGLVIVSSDEDDSTE